MTTYRCRKCPPTASGSATYHPGTWACPEESHYDPTKVIKYNERKTRSKEAMKAKPKAPAGGAPTPAAEGPPPMGLVSVELGTQIAETVRRDQADKKAEQDWVLPEDASETFFGAWRGVIRTIAHWGDDMLDAKHTDEGEIKDSIFEMNKHDISGARSIFARRLATKFVKGLGATTVEEGVATVDSLAFLVMFGEMILQVFGHFIKVGAQSPKLKVWREKAAERKRLKEERVAKGKDESLTPDQKAAATTTTATAIPRGP